MTKLKDLPEGTLLISDNGRKGLYSNDNAPIFIMELGGKKANVLWQGTSRYDAFMHPLTKKGKLEKNVDYVLPEDVNLYLPTFLDARSFMSSNSETFCLKVTNGTSKETTNKYCVKMSDLDYLKEPKFTVQITHYGGFLNEELIGDTPSYLRGTADEDHFCSNIHSKGTDETSKGTADKYYVKMNDFSYLNVDTSGALDTYWENSIKLSDNCIAFEASKRDTPWIHTLFTPNEYNSIAEEINQDGSWDEQMPLFDPDNPMFEKADGTPESNKEKDNSESDTLDEPTFKVHVGNQYNRYLNVQNPGIENIWNDTITLDDGRVVFASDDFPYNNVRITFTLPEYKYIYNKVKSMDTNGEEPSHLPKYDPSDTANFELVHGESLPEDTDSEKAPKKKLKTISQSQVTQLVDGIHLRVQKDDDINNINIDDNGILISGSKIHITGKKEPKFTVQVTPYGDFLNEELLGDASSRLRGTVGTVDGDQAYLLNGHILFIDDDSNDDEFKTHFTLEEYNNLREQVSLLEGSEDLSWSLPEYSPDNASFTLAEGSHLPEPVKESNKEVSKLPQWVKDSFDNLVEHADDPTLFTKEINTLVRFMGEKNWGFYLYQKLNRMQNALKNHEYSKNEVVAASKSIVKAAKKYY